MEALHRSVMIPGTVPLWDLEITSHCFYPKILGYCRLPPLQNGVDETPERKTLEWEHS